VLCPPDQRPSCYIESVTATGSGTLYLVATPIGNLEDITLRALRILREVALIAAEDTRRTRKLLSHHAIPARLVSLHEHNERTRTPEIIDRLMAGDSVALVSDAGTPGLSDPGVELVRQAVASGIAVVPLPGPSAFVTALVTSGLSTAPVTFLGFLPAAARDRQRELEAHRTLPHTIVIYEAPHRLLKALQSIRDVWGNRKVAVARELTKIHEEIFRGGVDDAIRHFTDHRPRGEVTVVVAGAAGEPPHSAEAGTGDPQAGETAKAMLRAALKEGVAPFEAVRRTSHATGLRRNVVYRMWLVLKEGAAG
jgi:16S rRNA (cytidine1402-2'-O)-methyltransferase